MTTAVRTLTVLEVDLFNPNSIDDDLKNTLKTVVHTKDSHIIIKSRRPVPSIYPLHMYVPISSGQFESFESNDWVGFVNPQFLPVPAGVYHWDGSYVYTSTSIKPPPIAEERRRSDDGSPSRMATIQEEPFKQEEEIPKIFAVCDLNAAVCRPENQKYRIREHNPLPYLHHPRHERKHSQQSGTSQGSSSSQASGASRKTSPPRRHSWSVFSFSTSNITKATRTGVSTEDNSENPTLLNGQEKNLEKEFGKDLTDSVNALDEAIYVYSPHLTAVDAKGNRQDVSLRKSIDILVEELKHYALQYCGNSYATQILPEDRKKDVTDLLDTVETLVAWSQLSGSQVMAKYFSRIAGSIIGALAAAYGVPLPTAFASIGVTVGLGPIGFVSLAAVSTVGLFAAGAAGGYFLGKGAGHLWDPGISAVERINSLATSINKGMEAKFRPA